MPARRERICQRFRKKTGQQYLLAVGRKAFVAHVRQENDPCGGKRH